MSTETMRRAIAWKRERVQELYSHIRIEQALLRSFKEDLRAVQRLKGLDLVMRANADDELPITNEELDYLLRELAGEKAA